MNRKHTMYNLLFVLILIGITDSAYLTYERLSGNIPPCATGFSLVDCGAVLKSEYSQIAGVPLSMLGLIHYAILLGLFLLAQKKPFLRPVVLMQTGFGFLFSLYLVYLQLVVINAICFYCMISAVVSVAVFGFMLKVWGKDFFDDVIDLFGWLYQNAVKPIFFLFDPERIHVFMVRAGELAANLSVTEKIVGPIFGKKYTDLSQKISGVNFDLPVGLAAGFDYEARLTKVLAPWGFGFQTVGTITNMPYEGNPKPMLGRLPKSKSLMVNKGYKNPGAIEVIKKIENIKFAIPVGISIGKTNCRTPQSQTEAVEDIIEAFKKFEKSDVQSKYYELNISCPNLYGSIEFYSRKNLDQLLSALDKLKIKRPIFVKMPIDKAEKEFLEILEVVYKHKLAGIIVGNLQKKRDHPSIDPSERTKYQVGNYSGKPTWEDSNRLIKLAYRYYGKKLVIIGCGGIFGASDAYQKIKYGASLVQLITGMVYQGPQIVAQINRGLSELLERDGYKSISEAVGVENKT